MSGKGDKRRPSSVSKDQFDENWERIFGSEPKYDTFPKDFDMTQAYDYGAPSRDGSHLTEEDRKLLKEYFPTDLWAFPPKDKKEALHEVRYDNMWRHSCTTLMETFWIGKDEVCDACGAWEEDGQ